MLEDICYKQAEFSCNDKWLEGRKDGTYALCSLQAKHQLNSWVYSAMFTACAAYKSAEHCMILTQAYHSLQNHFKEVKAAGDLSPSELRYC